MKHLELIQGVINQMVSNSFKLKGWAVTLASGVFALASKDADKMYFLITYVPVIVFWLLDSYYLWQERLYRTLYNDVRTKDENNIDFLLNVSNYANNPVKNTFGSSLLSKTEILFYIPLALICTCVIIITHI